MATKYFMSGGTDNDWSGDDNWSTTASAGPSNTTHAVAADAVILDAGSPNCTVDATSACTSIVCTGYTGTLTMNADITTTGTITLVSGMTFTPNATNWNFGGTNYTITGASKIFNNVTFTGTGTKTLGGADLLIAGNLTVNTAITATIATSNITLNGNLTLTGNLAGTGRTLTIAPAISTTSTWSGTGSLGMNLTINGAGAFVVSGSVSTGGNTITYTAASSVTTTSSTLTVAGNTTFNCAAIAWNNVSSAGTPATWTLTGALDINGNFLITRQVTFTTSDITVAGNLTLTIQSPPCVIGATSPRKIVMDGSGTISLTTPGVAGTSWIACDLEINTAGTVIFSGVVWWGAGAYTLTYTAGTITWGTSTLAVLASGTTVQTLNLPNQTLYNLFVYGTGTSSAAFLKFTAGTTVGVSNQFTVVMPLNSIYGLATTSASTDINLNLTNTILFPIVDGTVSFTDIDCSGGRAILSPGGTLTRCTNIVNAWTSYPRTSAGGWA